MFREVLFILTKNYKQPKYSFVGIFKQTVVHPLVVSRLLLDNKKEQTIDSQMHYVKWKKPYSQGNILYDSTDI